MAGCKTSKDSKYGKKHERDFPDKLSGFGYEFKEGKLRDIQTGGPFQFVVREGDQSYNQRHYEALGEVITEEVYNLLETECKLEKRVVPFDYDDEKPEPHTFIFVSSDAFTNPDKLLVLIHGSGVVRAGQWARRLIINDSIASGTQIPFIQRAQGEGYGILVMNTNDNRRESRKGSYRIRESENPENHAAHVWEYYIKKAKAKYIALIAHSYGGCVTTALFRKERDDFKDRVFAVAMTDSVHYISNKREFKDLVKISCNWVSSSKSLDTPLSSMPGDIKRVSAGVNVHEQTSWFSFESVFKFLRKRYDAFTKGTDAEADEGVEEDDFTVAPDRQMSVGSDSALDNTDVDMKDLSGEDDSLLKVDEEDTTEGEKMTAEGSIEEGKELDENPKKEDKALAGEDDTKGNASPDAKTTEGDEMDKSAKKKAKTGEKKVLPDVEMTEVKDTIKEAKAPKGEDDTQGNASPDAKTTEGDEIDKSAKKKAKTKEGKDLPDVEMIEAKDPKKEAKAPEGEDDTKGNASPDAKTTEGDETDKSAKKKAKTEGKVLLDVEMTEVKDTIKEAKAPEGEDENDTKGKASPDAKTPEGNENDKSAKKKAKTKEGEDLPDVEMTEAKDTKGAHSISNSEEEDEKETDKQKKQKKKDQ